MTALDVFTLAEWRARVRPDDAPRSYVEEHIYVVEFGYILCKVGRTGQLDRRIDTHIRSGTSLARPVTRVAVSPPHVEGRRNETTLKRLCREALCLPSSYRPEFFVLSLESIIALAAGLPERRATAAEIAGLAQRQEAVVAGLKGIVMGRVNL
jgi:hypothetical protein